MTQPCICIYRNRKELTTATLGAVAFASLGLYLLTCGDLPTTLHIIAIATLCVFGLFTLIGCYFLFRKKSDPLVVLTEKSLTLHNGDGSNYQIPWQRITDIEAVVWLSKVVLLIRISDPEQAIADETNPLYRKSLEFNYKRIGSPYCIIPSTLDYPKGALLPLLRKLHKTYGNP